MPLTKTDQKHIQELLTKKGRKEQGRFLVSGVRLLEEAVRWQFQPEILLFSPNLLSERANALLEKLRRKRPQIEAVSDRLLAKLADTVTPQGIAAVFPVPEHEPAELFNARPRTILVCENISDPGNLGSLARSALAFDCPVLLTIGTSAERYSPKVVRSSAGAMFGLKTATVTAKELLIWRERIGAAILAADINGKPLQQRMLSELLHDRTLLLCIGSEADGLSETLKMNADYSIRIPHETTVESLNAAMAGTILLHDLYAARK